MKRAIELSDLAVKHGNYPFGAVVVKDGVMVAEGENRAVTECDPTACGEMTALRNAGKALGTYDLKGCVVYASCEPCAMCVGAFFFANISGVFYGIPRADAAQYFDTSKQFAEIAKPIEQRWIPATNLCAKEAFKVMDEWGKEHGSVH